MNQVRPKSQGRKPSLGTTEVPDFAALHEKEKRRLERRKYQNRKVTQPAPFDFHAPNRGTRSRQPPMHKDPSQDWRWKRAQGVRASSASAAGYLGNKDGGGNCFS